MLFRAIRATRRPELARLTTIARLFERRACEDLTARGPVTATRLGASRYVSQPVQRCAVPVKLRVRIVG